MIPTEEFYNLYFFICSFLIHDRLSTDFLERLTIKYQKFGFRSSHLKNEFSFPFSFVNPLEMGRLSNNFHKYEK